MVEVDVLKDDEADKEEMLINLPVIGKKFQKKYMDYDEEHYKGKYSYVEAVSGCFFMIKSEAIKRINYFDENPDNEILPTQ